jgi:hypothetical protein
MAEQNQQKQQGGADQKDMRTGNQSGEHKQGQDHDNRKGPERKDNESSQSAK